MAAHKLAILGFILHLLPKFIPFPFFIPFFLGMMIYMIYKADKGAERNVIIFLVAFQFAPYMTTKQLDLNSVQEWGNTGPNAAPMKGVYLFNGLGAATIDFSHCQWHSSSKVAYCHPPAGNTLTVYPTDSDLVAAGLEVTADGGDAGPSQEEMSKSMPWQLFWMFYMVGFHNRIDFHFNDELTEAQVFENICIAAFATPSPLAYVFPYGMCTTASIYPVFRTFTMVKDDRYDPPTWYRNTYINEKGLMGMYDPIKASDKQPRSGGTVYPARMVFKDGYKLEPILAPDKSGKAVLNKYNLAKAVKVADGVVISPNM